MVVETKKILVKTKPDLDIVDITEKISEILGKSKAKDGIVVISVSGSTASISTMEFEPNLVKDVKNAIERLTPSDMPYEHHKTWGDKNGKSHVRATLLGPSIAIPFQEKRLLLGTWQQIVLLDFDIPAREREIILQIVGE